MGVYIKGLEMPQKGLVEIIIAPDGICYELERPLIDTEHAEVTKYSDAIAVPDHGDLLPTIEPKQGKWLQKILPLTLSDGHKDCVQCSNCRTHWDVATNYCPNCGAKMDVSDRKIGKWVEHIMDYWCSECGGRVQKEKAKMYSECPYCGARMEGSEDERTD